MPPSVYLLHGPDEFALTEFVRDLKAKMGDPATAELNTSVLEGRTAQLSEIRSLCGAMPFLAARRLVIVDGWLTRLLGKNDGDDTAEAEPEPEKKTGSPKEQMAALAEFLPTVPPTTALVLIEKRALPEKNIVLKAASQGAWAVVKFFDVPKGEALVSWIRARAKASGGELTREAAQALGQVENDPRALGQEITKLLTYVAFARPVEIDDVETLTPAGGEAKVFDMVDAIGQKRGAVALRELHKILEHDDPLYALSMIVRQFRLMLQAKELLESRTNEAEIARTLGLHPFPTSKICAQARNFSLPTLERIYRRLLESDIDIKTGQMDARVALDTLVGALTLA